MFSNTIVHLVFACSLLNQVLGISEQRMSHELEEISEVRSSILIRDRRAVECPEKNGRYPVDTQCDAYIECVDGVPEQKLCPDGLLFNPNAGFNYPCGYPIDVECGDRWKRQEPQPTENCPHQYGYFKYGDRNHCGQFVNCAAGKGYIFDCPDGLAFNVESYKCDWPDQVPDCEVEAYLGFRCPDTVDVNKELKFYPSQVDCQHYYVCVNGKPRLQDCGEGNAFNDLINACDSAKNVTGCEPGDSTTLSTQSTPTVSTTLDSKNDLPKSSPLD